MGKLVGFNQWRGGASAGLSGRKGSRRSLGGKGSKPKEPNAIELKGMGLDVTRAGGEQDEGRTEWGGDELACADQGREETGKGRGDAELSRR